MKNVILLVAFVVAASANAAHYKCSEKAADAIAKHRNQYSVFVTTLGEIKDGRVVGKKDRADRVRISLLSRDPKAGSAPFRLDRPSFEAVAKSEDVLFYINAKRTHGFSLTIYLDELGETSMSLAGVRGEIRMKCSSNQ